MSGLTDVGARVQVFFTADGRRLDFAQGRSQLGIEIECARAPQPGIARGERYRISLRNAGAVPRRVDRAGITLTAAVKELPATQGTLWRVFQDAGVCGWCGVKRLDALDADPHLRPVREPADSRPFHRSSLQSLVWDASGGSALLIGFLGQRRGPGSVDVVPDPSGRTIERIDAWQEIGQSIAPGEVVEIDPLVSGASNDPYGLLEEYAALVAAHHGRTFGHAPFVGMMTWYGYRTAVDERVVLENARIIADLLRGYPQPMRLVMLVDHGWQEDANWGSWEPDSRRFGRGMEALARDLRGMGVELGLWYTPFCVTDNAPYVAGLEPLLARDASGIAAAGSASVWGALPGHSASGWRVRYLDAAREEVQAKWREELLRMRGWGTSYWKLDFFSLRTSDAGTTTPGIGDLYARTWKTFRDAVGAEGHLAPCSCPTNMQLGYSDSVRIASDIGNAGHWPGAMGQFRYGMSTIAALWYKHGSFWVNDADSIQIAKGCSLNEARVRATVVAMGGGHLMLSEDLRRVDGERLEMIRRILPPCPVAARPLDLFQHPFPEGYPALWAQSVPHESGKTGQTRTALAVFNLETRTRTFRITPSMLGLPEDEELLALEWWQSRWLGRFRGAFELEVPPEDVAVIHAQPVGVHPGLVSVSHHITGGTILRDLRFDAGDATLRGVLETRADLPVVLYGSAPAGWVLGGQAQHHGAQGSTGGWQVEVKTTGQRTPFEIAFQRRP